ncbi:CPBP family intramembrane glutamic endopeptidase [Plantactinospora soyae]|uniref:Membrane protease YdiL (CAAX protease family) n=1 Tax=Plantactinospora soyae TaxID=1544732 RepID=A0A927M3F6_9ACTN|nr:type II CAAX endopeptidase family protein [Plantactinospora soyae]MBE1486086.1 membrane protease YdiL (CAAX protease family) [Plantactinospora soyae]
MTIATPASRQSGLALFFAVTFAWTGVFWFTAIALGGSTTSFPTAIFFLLGGFGPTIGAIVVRARRARLRQPVPARTVRLRLGMRLFWVLPLLAMASATVLAGALLAYLLGGPELSLTSGQSLIATVGGPVPFFISMLIGGPLAEEPGWRGTAYPRLRASMSRLQVGLLMGAAWAVWHLPLFFIPGTIHAEFGLISWNGLLFSVNVIPMALLIGYAYERAGVLAAIAVHFGVNTTIALLGVKSPMTLAFIVAVQVIVALTLLASYRDRRPELPVQVDADPYRVDANPYPVGPAGQVDPDATYRMGRTHG